MQSNSRYRSRSILMSVARLCLALFVVLALPFAASAAGSLPLLAITDAGVLESNTGTVNVTFKVALSVTSAQAVTVQYATADDVAPNSATAGTDYTAIPAAAPLTITFDAGETAKTITVAITGDTSVEANETFLVKLSNPTNAALGSFTLLDANGAKKADLHPQGIGTIVDNDGTLPLIGISDAGLKEGNVGSTSAITFKVRLSQPSATAVTVNYAATDGTAVSTGVNKDYVAIAPGTITLGADQGTEKTITTNVIGDAVYEDHETFSIELTNASGATTGSFPLLDADGTKLGNLASQGTGTIFNDDALPTLSISDVTVAEGDAATQDANFTVTLSAASSKQVAVNYATADGQATASVNGGASDYSSRTGTLTFAANTTTLTQTVSVPIVGDTRIELLQKKFFVNLSAAVNANIGDHGVGIGTITDNDLPAISISNIQVPEGSAGTTNATFTLSLSASSPNTVTVNAATADGTAVAGSDYVALANTLVTFDPGQTTRTLAVALKSDLLNEPDETFMVNLTNAANATLAGAQATGTIQNDDALPALSIDDVTVTEGNTGTANATFTVTLSAPSGQVVTVNVATANGTAIAGNDYTGIATTLTFNPGEITKAVIVAVTGDIEIELNETVLVNLAGPLNATLAKNQGVGTIVDNDQPTISINDVTVTEGNTGSANATFTVSLSKASPFATTVTIATADGTAVASSDYNAITATPVTFAAGATSKTVSVAIVGDTVSELTEKFVVTLSNPINGALAKAQGIGTILDTDAAVVSINDVTLTPGGAGTTINANFVVSLQSPCSKPVTVSVSTANGPAPNAAIAGSDYSAILPTTLTFNPGTTTMVVAVPVMGSNLSQADKTFLVNLSSATNATIAKKQGVGTIANNAVLPAISITNVKVTEGSVGTTVKAVFTVSLSRPSNRIVTVFYATTNLTASQGTAVEGGDYLAQTGILSFPAGTTTTTIAITVNGDARAEPSETFGVDFSIPVNATLAKQQGIGTITNDD